MGVIESISLFTIMVTLALVPSTSVALVVTRSATLNVANGVAVAAGIVMGDLVFILLAIFGLSVVAETMGSLFMFVKYLGGAYLLWLGFSLLTTKTKRPVSVNKISNNGNLIASFLAGFFLTLGDIKAIFFYVSLFPTFLDLAALTINDVLIIIAITVAAVGGVKVFYAFSARKVVSMSRGLKLESAAKKAAGGFMLGAGSYLLVKT